MSPPLVHSPLHIEGTRFGQLPRSLRLIPGLVLLAAIGLAGKWCEQSLLGWGHRHGVVVPDIDYVLWAILVGLAVGNVIGLPRAFRAGVATCEFWLKTGIILLGAQFVLADVARLGGISLVVVGVELALSILLMTWLGNRFGLPPKLTSLLAIGSSICGVSAIIAAKAAIDARDDESATAIAVILGVGAVSLFLFPLIGHAVGLNAHAFGLFAGLGIDNTAEAVAAGALWSDSAARIAVLAKTTRNATIGFVVLGFALFWARQGAAPAIRGRIRFLWRNFPKFVLGFLAVSLAASAGAFSPTQTADLAALAHWAFLLTFAGVGLRTSLRELGKQGWRPFAVGAIGEVFIALVTLGLVYGADRYLHL